MIFKKYSPLYSLGGTTSDSCTGHLIFTHQSRCTLSSGRGNFWPRLPARLCKPLLSSTTAKGKVYRDSFKAFKHTEWSPRILGVNSKLFNFNIAYGDLFLDDYVEHGIRCAIKTGLIIMLPSVVYRKAQGTVSSSGLWIKTNEVWST